jgi:hypothetical protein
MSLQLEDDAQVALEPARSTEQETSRPPERVRSFKHLALVFFLRFCPLDCHNMFSERINLK